MDGYSELLPEEGRVPVRAQRLARKAVVGFAVASIAVMGYKAGSTGAVASLFARDATAHAVGGAKASKSGLTTIGAADVAICTDATSTDTADCWKDYGGVCMYEKKSCSEYGGTKNSTGCGDSNRCFCCQDIDSSLIGDDDAVLAWIDSFIGDDDKRASRKSSKGGKGGKSSH